MLRFTLQLSLQNEKLKGLVSKSAAASLVCYVLHMHPFLKQFYVTFPISRLYPESPLLYTAFCMIVSISVFLISIAAYHLLKGLNQKLNRFILKIIENLSGKLESQS